MIYQQTEVSRQKSVDRSQKPEAGFTMVELMVTMVVFVLAISAASQIFTKLLTQFKQQSKVAETNIEGIVGLDLTHATCRALLCIVGPSTDAERQSRTP